MGIVKDKARMDALPIGRFQADLLDFANATGAALWYLAGNYEWLVWGTWDGATATLQQSPDLTSDKWIDFNAAVATADGRLTGIPISKSYMRVALTNVGANTRLYSTLNQVDRNGRY